MHFTCVLWVNLFILPFNNVWHKSQRILQIRKEWISVLFNKAFVCCMIELILWFSKEMERKIWIIAKLSKEHKNEIKKQQMYELKLYCYLKGKSSLGLSFSLRGSEKKHFQLTVASNTFLRVSISYKTHPNAHMSLFWLYLQIDVLSVNHYHIVSCPS